MVAAEDLKILNQNFNKEMIFGSKSAIQVMPVRLPYY